MKTLNEGLRALLELASLAALAYWGWRMEGSTVLRVATAMAAPGLAATAWALWVAPRSSRRLSDPLRLLVELGVFGSATLGLIVAGRRNLGIAFCLVVVVNLILMTMWSQR